MGGDNKLETMQEELKLLKGELKQSLSSVRDYLLNMELPASEFSTILEALDGGDGQKVTMSGTLGTPVEAKPAEEAHQEIIEPEPEMPPENDNLIDVEEPPADEAPELAEDSPADEDEKPALEETMLTDDKPAEESQPEVPDIPEETLEPELELPPGEDQPIDLDGIVGEANLATPKVNMLANLVPWVAKAKKEIGYDQLPAFLEVYGISGHLSSELKEVIMHMAQITDEKSEVANNPEIWSQTMLSLHGILTGGDAPAHPLIPFMTDSDKEDTPTEDEPAEEEKPKEPPFKLKLVFPNGDGKSKEFCINLTPEEDDSDASPSQSKN
jgi:hypothetical protein